MRIEKVLMKDIHLPQKLVEIRKQFNAVYSEKFGKPWGKGLYKKEDWARIAFCYQEVCNTDSVESVLDVGVGPGALLNIFQMDPCFSRVTGIDKVHFSKLVVLGDLDIRIMDAGQMTFSDNEFDCVICMEVLEHLEYESFIQVLSELRRVAAKRLFITVPFCEQEPLPVYHKLRFEMEDIEHYFPTGRSVLLERESGAPWLFITEEIREG